MDWIEYILVALLAEGGTGFEKSRLFKDEDSADEYMEGLIMEIDPLATDDAVEMALSDGRYDAGEKSVHKTTTYYRED